MEPAEGLGREGVSGILWKIAERKDIVIVQTFTQEHFKDDANVAKWDAQRIHKELGNGKDSSRPTAWCRAPFKD